MDPEPSTSKAATSKTGALDAGGPTPSDGVPEVVVSTIGPVPLLQQQHDQQFVFHRPVTMKQIQQLFVATCHVKLQRCEVPVTTTSTPITVNNAAIAPPLAASDAPPESTTVRKVEQESDTTTGSGSSSSSEEDEDVKVLATFPPSASSTNNRKKTVIKKKGGQRGVHRKSSVQCSVCKKTFSSKKSLKVHSRKHTGEMRHRCENCGRSFWSRSAYVGHKKTRDQRNGVCPREQKKLKLYGRWRPKGAWNCKICGKRMKYAGSYVAHMRSHRGDKPFKCGECGKALGSKWALTLHRRMHNGVWQYNCVFCDKGFRTKGNYWHHLRGHTEEKPYFCVVDGCGQCFRARRSLKQHRRLIHLKKY